MTFAPSDLGDVERLARAAGIVKGDGSFNNDWLSNPGTYLSAVLANDAQRDALLGLIDDLLGGGARQTDASGLIWLPLFENASPKIAFYAVVDDQQASHIRVGLGVRVSNDAPVASMGLHIPLFKAARGNASVGDPILLGKPGGRISFSCDITVDAAAPQPGQPHLRAVGLVLDVPTDGAPPDFALTIGGLQLPGAASPRNLTLSVANVAQLDDIVLDLVLGLLEAQARQAGGAIRAFTRLIGLSAGTPIPTFPLDQLATKGAAAIGTWAAAVFGAPAARTAWLQELAALLQNGAGVSGDRVTLPFGAARVTFGIDAVPGAGGLPVITPTLGIEAGAGQVIARVDAKLLRLDLGSGAAVAIPGLDAFVLFGKTPLGGAALLAGDPAVDAIRFGIALDEARRPAATLGLVNVRIGTNPAYPFLDLSSPDAVVATAGQVADDLLDQVLGSLGPLKDLLRLVLGLSVPPGIPGLVPTSIPAFLGDPLGAVRAYWRGLVADHAAAVPQVLAPLRDLVADQAVVAEAVGGTGTLADPWKIKLVGPAALTIARLSGGDRVELGIAASYMNDQLGERCTRLDADIAVGLLTVDLAGGPVAFLSAIRAGIRGRPRGVRRAAIDVPPVRLSADGVGLQAIWTPASGLSMRVAAPNPTLTVNEIDIPLDMPDFSAGFAGLSPAQWDAVEIVAGQLAALTSGSWIADLVRALGWIPEVPTRALSPRPRLRLAQLVADPQAALLGWANDVLLRSAAKVEQLLVPLARLLTGTRSATGRLQGAGTPKDPYRLPLAMLPGTPAFALWVEPNGPPLGMATAVPNLLKRWRPGMPGLSSTELATALFQESRIADDIGGMTLGRPHVGLGLDDLLERFVATDGLILAPTAPIAGITVHAFADRSAASLSRTPGLGVLLGVLPATVIHVTVAESVASSIFADRPADRRIDMTAPGLAPNAFPLPAAATGEWHVVLGLRAACRLASGDADGVGGQAGRLERALQPFRALAGTLALVAHGGAGHAARRVAQSVTEIDTLVTLGTSYGPVAFSVLTTEPAASTLRLLSALIPDETPGDPFDADLALGRDLVRGLLALTQTPGLADEFAPPADATATPRAGLAVHAVFGTVSTAAAARAMTAIVAAGLSLRATARSLQAEIGAVTGVGAGLTLPFSVGTGGLVVSGHVALEFFGANLTAVPALRQTRPLSIHLEVRRADGWLIGGPGSTSGQDLRWLEANLTLPLGAAGQADAEVILHEPRVFTIRRDRWIVRGAGAAGLAGDVVTPALPEVGVLISGVMRELALDPDPALASVLDLFEALGVFAPQATGGIAGFVPSALDSLLNQPAAHFAALLADALKRAPLQTAIAGLAAAVPGLTVNLAQRRADLALTGAPGTVGLLPWSVTAFATATGTFGGTVRLGATGSGLRLDLSPFAATLELPRLAEPGTQFIALWPQPDVAPLVAELPSILIANAARIGLDYLRELDDGARPVIEAVLDAIGLLDGAAGDAVRAARVPRAFLAAPVAWFRDQAAFGDSSGAFSPARVIAFVDALKPLLGLNGASGTIALANGVRAVVSGTGGALQLALALDGSALASPPGNPPRLAFGGTFGLRIGPGSAISPAVSVFAGLPGGGDGRKAVHLEVGQGVSLFVRPPAGPDISLYPNPPGLGSLAEAALQVLPFVLDEIAALTAPPPAAATASAVVRAVGDALDLRTADAFDAAKLAAWAQNPPQRFADRLPQIGAALLTNLANAIGPALPAGLTVSDAGGHLIVQAGPFELDLALSPFALVIRVDATAVPFAQTVSATIGFGPAGLTAFSGTVGPASIPVNGVPLRPLLAFAAGPAAPGGARIEVGGALAATGPDAVFARWTLPAGAFALVFRDAGGESTAPEDVALGLIRVAMDLVARFAMATPALTSLLDTPVPNTTAPNVRVRTLFRNVFLDAAGTGLDPALFDPDLLLGRFMRLLRNVAEAGPSVNVGGGIAIGAKLESQIVKLTLGVNGRIDIASGDVRVSIEADSRWIKTHPVAGLAIGFLDISGTPAFRPSLSVNGLGIRIGRASGPLLDSVVKLGSVATHFFADIAQNKLSGGVQLQFSDLGVSAGGAGGGNNDVAKGVMGDTGSGSNALAPAFSPALAVQKHGSGPILVSLSAGEGDGPWWLTIQKGFGPLYVEQVGFGVTVQQDQLQKIAVLFDGRVSIAGLVAAVDDLQITFTVMSNASLFDPSRWAVDLAGLAVSADIAGVVLAGGLRKFETITPPSVEYIGMLTARVATYGLSIYGGYGTGVDNGSKFSAFFAFGAVTGPIGGPPAFFLTGIGGGFGINRDLKFPESLQKFANFVMIEALDPSASGGGDPMTKMADVRNAFPMKRDRFWFAAGISFTSFAIVDGIAVVAVSFGGGFELTLLGLARMALPRPQFRLVSIELGLIARFSTRDGVIWIQAELTENSWLLHESVRLTGGFAYVMWFDGPKKGEFVLTLGGYHPNFHRDGYPQVPRLGFRWQVEDAIVIKGENYFALTSEAIMAGGALEASARFGPAWANVSFGANAIIYFDPFRYEADAHARISAGVTVDLWLGEVTFSISLGATIKVAGPDFHGSVTFEVGPIELTVEFGDKGQTPWEPISWEAFVTKYLEAASPGVARLLTASTGKGTIPPGTGANGEEKGTADGSAAHPFEVLSEFEVTLTTLAPASEIRAGPAVATKTPSKALGIAPVGDADIQSKIALSLLPKNPGGGFGADTIGALRMASTSTGAFPIGAWGKPQSRQDKKVPKGDIIEALNGTVLVAEAQVQETIPAEIAFNQVEAGPRKPLPFVVEKDDRIRVLAGAKQLVDLLPDALQAEAIYETVKPWMTEAGNSPLAMAALAGDRAAPPRLGALGERLILTTPSKTVALATADGPRIFDHAVKAPVAVAVLSPLLRRETRPLRTTVKATEIARVLAPTFDDADRLLEGGLAAKLVRVPAPGGRLERTLGATGRVPPTRQARMAAAAIDGRGADALARSRLAAVTAGLSGAKASGPDALVRPGEVAVLALPNADSDSAEGARPVLQFDRPARIVMLASGGAILADMASDGGKAEIPRGTETIVVWGGVPAIVQMAGWHETQSLPFVGWATCLCAGGSVEAESALLARGPESRRAGWTAARTFLAGSRTITTRFSFPATTLVVLVDEFAPGDAAATFSLLLDGAEVARDEAGREIEPILFSSGDRRALVYALTPDRKARAVIARVQREGTIGIAGVMAAETDAGTIAARLSDQTPEAMLDLALPGPGEPVTLRFVAARDPVRPRRRGNR